MLNSISEEWDEGLERMTVIVLRFDFGFVLNFKSTIYTLGKYEIFKININYNYITDTLMT